MNSSRILEWEFYIYESIFKSFADSRSGNTIHFCIRNPHRVEYKSCECSIMLWMQCDVMNAVWHSHGWFVMHKCSVTLWIQCDIHMDDSSHMNAVWRSYESFISRKQIKHYRVAVTHVNEFSHGWDVSTFHAAAYEWVMWSWHTSTWVMVRIWISAVSHMTRHAYGWGMSHKWMRHSVTYEWDMSHVWTRHVTHVNGACHGRTNNWVIAHKCIGREAHTNKSRHTRDCVLSRMWMRLCLGDMSSYAWVMSHT